MAVSDSLIVKEIWANKKTAASLIKEPSEKELDAPALVEPSARTVPFECVTYMQAGAVVEADASGLSRSGKGERGREKHRGDCRETHERHLAGKRRRRYC